jgi:hypothetical protein
VLKLQEKVTEFGSEQVKATGNRAANLYKKIGKRAQDLQKRAGKAIGT